MNLKQTIGFSTNKDMADAERIQRVQYLKLQLAAHGLVCEAVDDADNDLLHMVGGLLAKYREKARMLRDYRCPADRRIEAFLENHFADLELSQSLRLPEHTFVLDQHGLARELSLPEHANEFSNDLVESYRVHNGVLHNPRHDRRTTKGTFHITEGGLPIPDDKKAVPKHVFANLYQRAWDAPGDMLTLPFTSDHHLPAQSFVSLLLRPLVCPEVPGHTPRITMETRFFAPGSLVSNLDFVESIFGNAGDPFLPINDAGLDAEHWSGHTGCVILAPHLDSVRKKDVGLPHYDDATERQRRDGMCWESEDELYNDGSPYKLTCRTEAGVVVTLIADNYYGYCKKEVKTQIGYAANLMGHVEEEHAGGAMAFASYNLGDEFDARKHASPGRTFDKVAEEFADYMEVQPEGYGIDHIYSNVVYVPEDAHFDVYSQTITWSAGGSDQSIPLQPDTTYITPTGYKVTMEKHPGAPTWRLVGTVAEGVSCHKPCTVSGGGKSEISKSLVDYMLYGPIFVSSIDEDFNRLDEIFDRDYSDRWRPEFRPVEYSSRNSRSILDPDRTLGSVIKLLTPSPRQYTDEYNQWLGAIPNYLHALVFIIKRLHPCDGTTDWRDLFGVDSVNGFPGHELKYRNRKVVGSYLRIGFEGRNVWRTYKLRQDFMQSQKIQLEDDISASVVLPYNKLENLNPAEQVKTSIKFVENCEYRLFQRPDDAIHRGLDKQTEWDAAQKDNFFSNFDALAYDQIKSIVEHVASFDQFTWPIRKLLKEAYQLQSPYTVCSANPRIVNGKPTKNPRYLQTRPDLIHPERPYIAEMGTRLARALSIDKPVHMPVNAVMFGRRLNPPDPKNGIRGMAVYNPIHYQELPELFMDFLCSLTGKSPSTTGAGTEGALTKGPFNCLRPIVDLNNALVSYVLTDLAGFSSAAGFIGPGVQVDHDISLLIPEIWCRLSPTERDPNYLLENAFLEKLEDFDHNGRRILASRLGYRITYPFVRYFFGRLFDNPSKVFDSNILKPETQNFEDYVDGIQNITETQTRVAKQYIDDGQVEDACPPLKALIYIMANGSYEDMDAHSPELRRMFTKAYVLESDWYRERLKCQQVVDIAQMERSASYIDAFAAKPESAAQLDELQIPDRRQYVQQQLDRRRSPEYVDSLIGCLGVDPSLHQGGMQRTEQAADLATA